MRHGPGSTSIRPPMVSAIVSALALVLLLTLSPAVHAQPSSAQSVAATTRFVDIRGNEWFVGAVYTLAEKGIVQGRQDGSFGPDDVVTRAHMAVFLARTLGLPESAGQPFLDVKASDWFAGAVGALYQRGLLQGTSPIIFSPAEPVSKQQAATLVLRSLAYALQQKPETTVDLELSKEETKAWLGGFHDRGLMAPAHKMSVANAYRFAFMEDALGGWFIPESHLTRSEMAVMLFRAFLQPVIPRAALPAEVPAVDGYKPLSSGSEGPLVAFLEAKLTALRYPCGPIDGVYDNRTRDAVMAFEKVERMPRNGKVGTAVWERLLTARTPSPSLSDSGTRCEVDLSRQVLLMITDDKVWKVVHVSTGKLGTRTGHFSIGAKYEGWVKCVTLDGEMYYPSYVVSKTAIHGYRSVPAYPASHGCVRIPVWITPELYHELPKGTVVDIYY